MQGRALITRFGSTLEHQSLRGGWREKGGGKERGQNGKVKREDKAGREQKGREGEERKGGDEVLRMPSVEHPASHAGNCPSIFCL